MFVIRSFKKNLLTNLNICKGDRKPVLYNYFYNLGFGCVYQHLWFNMDLFYFYMKQLLFVLQDHSKTQKLIFFITNSNRMYLLLLQKLIFFSQNSFKSL